MVHKFIQSICSENELGLVKNKTVNIETYNLCSQNWMAFNTSWEIRQKEEL